jgi:acetyl coenzyme A synthetase (ADP forming)-like protein
VALVATVHDDTAQWASDVVLADGGTVHVRPLRVDDSDALVGLYERLSAESIYLRFFSPVPRPTAAQLERLTELDAHERFAFVAELGDEIVAVARYDIGGDPTSAEVAFVVEDDQQGRGIASVLLEHLAAYARAHGITRFVADTLPHNRRMLNVFTDAGWEVERKFDSGAVRVTFDIAPTEAFVARSEAREHTSERASVARLLAPRSVAVIGASRTAGTIGHELFRNLLLFGFTGAVYPVNPNAAAVGGVRAYATVEEIPDAVDLAVIVVPAIDVPAVVEQCAAKRVHGLVVISAGFAETGDEGRAVERALVTTARAHGMRMIGPNCMGVVNTATDIALNATFSPVMPAAGRVGFSSQSGGLGIELMARATSRGLGISQFVSVGNKADVSGNDLLQFWEQDANTDVILLYLESFGNPRKFARLARRIAHTKPIVAVKSGRTAPGRRAASSHTAALASSDVAVDALFRQAGVVRVDTLEELFDAAELFAHQPLPSGRRIGIVGNAGGPGILAADACAGAGLDVPVLSDTTQSRLRSFLDPGAAVRNPVDLIASASAEQYEQAMNVVLADESVDAVLVHFVPPLVTRAEDVAAAIRRAAQAASARDTPIVACFLGHDGIPEGLRESTTGRAVPSYAFPEAAARALGHAAALSEWRARPTGSVPSLEGIDESAARVIVNAALARSTTPDGVWLAPTDASALVQAYGVPVIATTPVASADEAVRAAAAAGYPVALKAAAPTLLHKSDVGGVALGLADEPALRAAYATMQTALAGDDEFNAVIQPMVAPGVEVLAGVVHERSFGPLVLFGLGGTTAELLADRALRILPLTDQDAHDLVRSLRGSPLLFGYRGRPRADVPAVEDLLLRIGRLADDVAELAEMDLNPVIVHERGVVVVDVKIRLAPVEPGPPPELRRLRAT